MYRKQLTNIIRRVPVSRPQRAMTTVQNPTKNALCLCVCGYGHTHVWREKPFCFILNFQESFSAWQEEQAKTRTSVLWNKPAVYLHPVSLLLFNFRQLQSYVEWCKGCSRLTGTLLTDVIIILAVIFLLILNGVFMAKRSGGKGLQSSDHIWSWLSAVQITPALAVCQDSNLRAAVPSHELAHAAMKVRRGVPYKPHSGF